MTRAPRQRLAIWRRQPLTRRVFLIGASGLALPAWSTLITSSGPKLRTSNGSSGGGGGGDTWPTTAEKYVSASGNNGNAGTSGSPYATVAFALSQISAGQSVMVLSDLTENLTLASLSAGSSGNYKSVIADTPGRVITGTIDGSGVGSKYLQFQGFHWLNGSDETDLTSVQFVKFIHCGFQGGPPSAGNLSQMLCGSNQLYESCYWLTEGGRYAALCYEQSNTLFRWCVVRTDNWGSPANDGNPSAAIQIYSSSNCARIQCVAIDCINQRSNNEWLGAFTVTTNTGSATNILDQEVFVVNGESDEIAMQVEGSSSATYQGLGNVCVNNGWGFVENLDSGSGSITITGGEYSNNANSGLARFGVENYTATNVNTTGNSGGNFNGAGAGSGCTTNALDMDAIVSNMVKRGVSGTMYGETGWNTQQAGEFMFPLPVEDLAKTKYAAFNSRGWAASASSLTDYLKAVA